MNLTTYLLIKIAEEAAEVAQMAAKTAVFGLNEVYAVVGKSNAERLADELRDLMTVVEMLNDHADPVFPVHPDQTSAAKVDKVEYYYDIASSQAPAQAREQTAEEIRIDIIGQNGNDGGWGTLRMLQRAVGGSD